MEILDDDWPNFVEEKVNSIAKSLNNEQEAYGFGLHRYSVIARKIHCHSKDCKKCKNLKQAFSGYLEELDSLPPKYKKTLYRDATKLRRKNFEPLVDHLLKTHSYKGEAQNTIDYITYLIIVNITLAVISYYTSFTWGIIPSLISITMGWLLGYSLDKHNKRKGIRIDSELFPDSKPR